MASTRGANPLLEKYITFFAHVLKAGSLSNDYFPPALRERDPGQICTDLKIQRNTRLLLNSILGLIFTYQQLFGNGVVGLVERKWKSHILFGIVSDSESASSS